MGQREELYTSICNLLLALPIGKRLCICVGFGLGNINLAHSLANVEMIKCSQNENLHMDVIFHVSVDVTLRLIGN